MLTAARRRPARPAVGGPGEGRRADPRHALAPLAACALLGSALVHATVVEEHLAEWAPAGLFFLVLVVVESTLGALAWRRPSPLVWLAVLVSSLGTVCVWSLSRSVGMPFGPPDFQVPEAVGQPDLVCVALEVAAALVAVLPRRQAVAGRHGVGAGGRAVGVVGAAIALALTVWTLAPTLAADGTGTAGGHHHGSHETG